MIRNFCSFWLVCVCVCVFVFFAVYQAYGIYGVVNLVAPLLSDASCLIESNRENTIIHRYDVTPATIFKCAHNGEKSEKDRKKIIVLNDMFFFSL